MKKIFLYLNLFIIPLLHLSTVCSEKSWLQGKLDAFTHKMITRHTYEHNSFEHIRDRALLFLVPPSTAQGVLTLQRSNMKNFLQQNEENAREKFIKFCGIDEQTSQMIKEQIKKSQKFNLDAMKFSHNVIHDPNLPPAWINIMKERCARRGININSLHLTVSYYDEPNFFAYAASSYSNDYDPAIINLNMNNWDKNQKQYIQHRYGNLADDKNLLKMVIDHELTHIIENHPAQWNIIAKHMNPRKMMKSLGLKQMSIQTIFESLYYKNWCAAQEKTSDTFLACTDQEISKSSIMSKMPCGYLDNHNDMKVIYTNWQTSQAIKDFQQLKSSIKQKLAAFPKFVA